MADEAALTAPEDQNAVVGCPDCGLVQITPPLQWREEARCVRCDSPLGRKHFSPIDIPLMWIVTGLLLALPAMLLPVFIVSAAGIVHSSKAEGTVIALYHADYTPLSVAMAAFSIALPVVWLIGLMVTLLCFKFDRRPPWIGTLFRLINDIDLWAMPDVFVMGGFVAYTRLQAVATVEIGMGGWAYLGLAFCSTFIRAKLDRTDMWRLIMPDATKMPEENARDTISCPHCKLVMNGKEGELCPRCNATIHRRKPQSFKRCLALVASAYLLYIPANLLPVLHTVRLGRVENHTIFNGAMELIQADMWPLAIIVLMASIAVPVLKLAGLTWFMFSIYFKSAHHIEGRTRLHRMIDSVGRWSNIDVFMIGLLTALVEFGNLTTITPAPGALAFAVVVVLTMLASRTFDSRLMWDAAAQGNTK